MSNPPTNVVADILRALSGLTGEELDQVTAKIALLKSNPFGGSKPARVASGGASSDELLVIAICEYFEGQGLDKCHPAMLRRVQGYSAFAQKVEPIVDFLTRGASSGSLTRTELMAFFRLGISLLHKNMQSMDLAVSPRTIMNQIHRLPSVIELSFPSYARNGRLRLVLQRR